MSASDLEALSISNLRGYVTPFTLKFDKTKRLCVVYGENGTGKTTLCDALELLGSGRIGSLEDRGLGKTERYWAPAGQASAGGRIELKTTGVTYTLTVTTGRVDVTPTGQRPQVEVFRRPQLITIVTAQAAKRYEAIARLVDVRGVEASEQALANLVKQVEADVDGRARRISGAQEVLQRQFATSVPEGGDALEWARREAANDDAELQSAAGALRALNAAYEDLVRRLGDYTNVTGKLALAREQSEVAAAEPEVAPAPSIVVDRALVQLLDAAARMFAGHDRDECPLCESPERAAGLAARVRERLDAMAPPPPVRDQPGEAQRALESARARVSELEVDYAEAKRVFLANLEAASSGVITICEPPPVEVGQLGHWLELTAAVKAEWMECHRELVVRTANLMSIREAVKTYDENVAEAKELTTLLSALKRGLERAQAVRRTFVNSVLIEISGDVGRLYEAIHPGEGLDRITLSMDEKRRASLDLSTRFSGLSNVPPQAYLSDSHLDTLGLCVFLCLARRRGAERTVLVLDDVLGSVDEPHVDRLIEMIYDEAQHFRHVLLTTHYRPWREKLRWGWLQQGQCQLVELGPWTANCGPSLVRGTGEIERLRKLLSAGNDFDVQAVCGKAGVVLEALLDFLTELYQCKLPRKARNEWTLGDLLPAIGKKLRATLRVEHQDSVDPKRYNSYQLGPAIEELQRVAQTRNLLGAHFNRLSFELLDADAKYFASKVLELADLVVHPEHGWPRNDKSGSYWASANDARRLHPLKEPS